MDLSQIENMILEILSEEEPPARVGQTDVAAGAKPGKGPEIQTRKGTDEETGLKITDLEHLEKYVDQNDDFIELTLKLKKILTGPDLNNLIDTFRVKGALEDPDNRNERDDLVTFLNQLESLAKQAGLINEEEVSLAAQKAMKKMEEWKNQVAKAIPKMRQMLQGDRPHMAFSKSLTMPFQQIKNAMVGVGELYMDLNQAIRRLKKAAKSEPAKKDTEGGTDSDGDGTPDDKEVKAGTDLKDPKDSPPTEDKPDTVDPPKEKTQVLVNSFQEFRDKFYCPIPDGANARERREALELCKEKGVAVSRNDQHELVRKLILALEDIIEGEEEAFKNSGAGAQLQEAKKVSIKSSKRAAVIYYKQAKSIESFLKKAQDNAGNRTGRMFLKRAIKRIKTVIEDSGELYNRLREIKNEMLATDPEPVAENTADENKTSGQQVEDAYNMVIKVVKLAVDKINDETVGDYKQDIPELKKVYNQLNQILKLFPKGKMGGKKSTSRDKVYDDYIEALNDIKPVIADYNGNPNEISDTTLINRLANSLRDFTQSLVDMYNLEMPAQFNDPVEDETEEEPTAQEPAAEPSTEPATDEPGEETTTDEPDEEQAAEEDPPAEISTEADLQKLFPTTFVNKVRRIEGVTDELIDSFGKFLVIYNNEEVVTENPDRVSASIFTHSKLQDKKLLSKKKSRRALKLMSRNRNLKKDYEVLNKWFYTGRTNTNAKKMFVKLFLKQYIDKGRPKFKMPLQKIISYQTSKALDVSENKQPANLEEAIVRKLIPIIKQQLRVING